MNNERSIFTSFATFTEKDKFSISFLLKNCNNLVYSNASAFSTETQLFPSRFASNDAFSVFTGYVVATCLQLKNSSKLRLNKQISRYLHRYNTYSRLRRPDVTCFHNVNLARLSDVINVVIMRDVISCQAG